MALSTKFFYELTECRARIQFYSDGILTNEWVVCDLGPSSHSEMVVPTSSGNTIPRKAWIIARLNVKKWVKGIDTAGLSFCDHLPQSNFNFEMEQDNDELSLKLQTTDTLGVLQNLRELTYDRITDEMTLAPRTETFSIYWVDYLNLLLAQDQFEILVNKLHNL